MSKVQFWDAELGEAVVRDMTEDELAELQARQAAPAPVPQSVTRYQAKAALLFAGHLNDVQPAINAIPNAEDRALAQIEWNDKQTFERNSPTLIALGASLGLSSDEIDDLFRDAATR